jgi:hypothetical protein
MVWESLGLVLPELGNFCKFLFKLRLVELFINEERLKMMLVLDMVELGDATLSDGLLRLF